MKHARRLAERGTWQGINPTASLSAEYSETTSATTKLCGSSPVFKRGVASSLCPMFVHASCRKAASGEVGATLPADGGGRLTDQTFQAAESGNEMYTMAAICARVSGLRERSLVPRKVKQGLDGCICFQKIILYCIFFFAVATGRLGDLLC